MMTFGRSSATTDLEAWTIGQRVRGEIDQIFSRLAEDIAAGKFGEVKDGTHVELFKANTCLIAAWDRYLERD